VVMLAHLHGKEPVDVATDVYNQRIKLGFWTRQAGPYQL
jgi:hypothetical protein